MTNFERQVFVKTIGFDLGGIALPPTHFVKNLTDRQVKILGGRAPSANYTIFILRISPKITSLFKKGRERIARGRAGFI